MSESFLLAAARRMRDCYLQAQYIRMANSHGTVAQSEDLKAGDRIRIVGLVAAAQHNDKEGIISARAATAGRVGVELAAGKADQYTMEKKLGPTKTRSARQWPPP